jgi:hypothetical protein
MPPPAASSRPDTTMAVRHVRAGGWSKRRCPWQVLSEGRGPHDRRTWLQPACRSLEWGTPPLRVRELRPRPSCRAGRRRPGAALRPSRRCRRPSRRARLERSHGFRAGKPQTDSIKNPRPRRTAAGRPSGRCGSRRPTRVRERGAQHRRQRAAVSCRTRAWKERVLRRDAASHPVPVVPALTDQDELLARDEPCSSATRGTVRPTRAITVSASSSALVDADSAVRRAGPRPR